MGLDQLLSCVFTTKAWEPIVKTLITRDADQNTRDIGFLVSSACCRRCVIQAISLEIPVLDGMLGIDPEYCFV
jgi:hypothetical protein